MYEEFNRSKCKANKWHEWKVLRSVDNMQREACIFCKECRWFNVEDNDTYRLAHMRAFAQPYGYTEKLYRSIHGDDAAKKMDSHILSKDLSKAKQKDLQEAYDTEMALDKKGSVTI